jgi:nucleotide-binding universal stress UspA family protein
MWRNHKKQPPVHETSKKTKEVYMSRKIGVGFDGSGGSRRALREAIRLAALEKADLHVISVEELPRYAGTVGEVIEEQDTANEAIKKLHDEAKQIAAEHGVQVMSVVRVGHPAKGLVDYSNETGLDLLVLGHTGHSALWGSFLGTTADKVIRHTPCSVLVVR